MQAGKASEHIDQILARIRHEAARRDGAAAGPTQSVDTLGRRNASGEPSRKASLTTGAAESGVEPPGIGFAHITEGSRLAPKKARFVPRGDGRYKLKDLLAYDDREFIQVAYLAILRRPADKGGLVTYLGRLRAGHRKEEILGSLLQSKEGKRAKTVVAGLWFSGRLALISQWPLIGWPLRLADSIAGLANAEMRRRAHEGRVLAYLETGLAQIREDLCKYKGQFHSTETDRTHAQSDAR